MLNEDSKKNFAFIELEKLLQVYNKFLEDFPPMRLPKFDDTPLLGNRLLLEELSYDRKALYEER